MDYVINNYLDSHYHHHCGFLHFVLHNLRSVSLCLTTDTRLFILKEKFAFITYFFRINVHRTGILERSPFVTKIDS
jgi:hypothetical protein